MHTSIHLSPRWCLPVGQYRFLYTFRISDAEDTFRTVGALFFVDAHFYTPFAPLGLCL